MGNIVVYSSSKPDNDFIYIEYGEIGNPVFLNKSLEYRRHSPDGFAWGYGGSGPAQLALAILLEFLTPKEALRLYQEFKEDIVAKQDKDAVFRVGIMTIMDWCRERTDENNVTMP